MIRTKAVRVLEELGIKYELCEYEVDPDASGRMTGNSVETPEPVTAHG
jgi:hypothetical protein